MEGSVYRTVIGVPSFPPEQPSGWSTDDERERPVVSKRLGASKLQGLVILDRGNQIVR